MLRSTDSVVTELRSLYLGPVPPVVMSLFTIDLYTVAFCYASSTLRETTDTNIATNTRSNSTRENQHVHSHAPSRRNTLLPSRLVQNFTISYTGIHTMTHFPTLLLFHYPCTLLYMAYMIYATTAQTNKHNNPVIL